MPPIPIHASSPINTNHPSNAFGTSPSSAAARYTPADVDAGPTTTTNPSPSGIAQPGAPAVPQPTNTSSSTYNNRFEPTATRVAPSSTAEISESPPPPQPGAVPSPYANTTNNACTPKLDTPQPPRPIETDLQQQQQINTSPIRHALPSPTPTRTHAPHNLPLGQIYSPTRSIPPAGMTSTYPAAQDLSHPPGYMQDSRASFDDKPVEFCQPLDRRASPSSSRRGGILDAEPTFESSGDDEGVLNTAYAWAKAAGKRLSRTEEQLWKKVNGMDRS
ncbi:hypothetical protein LTR84_001757 [Exophiala bonariae]|uniref:Uncharacterized protein n=1 Tax=Exophiala bonariae TaxID=1690606 RepID=A0AAV9NCD7_9EURO|nr:hypothetical protein LTR84_001757 [Exophiala bonariae]